MQGRLPSAEVNGHLECQGLLNMACVFEQIAYISAYLFLIVDFQEFLFGLRAADVYGKLADSVFLAVV